MLFTVDTESLYTSIEGILQSDCGDKTTLHRRKGRMNPVRLISRDVTAIVTYVYESISCPPPVVLYFLLLVAPFSRHLTS